MGAKPAGLKTQRAGSLRTTHFKLQQNEKKIIGLFVIIGLTTTVNAQQISLYDSEGEARAYIDYDEEATIFMWDGTLVAFVEKDGRDLCVFWFQW